VKSNACDPMSRPSRRFGFSRERIWTVLATCAVQKRDVLAYLTAALEASFRNQPAPSLMPTGP